MSRKARFLACAIEYRAKGWHCLLKGAQLTLADIRYNRRPFVMETGK